MEILQSFIRFRLFGRLREVQRIRRRLRDPQLRLLDRPDFLRSDRLGRGLLFLVHRGRLRLEERLRRFEGDYVRGRSLVHASTKLVIGQ